ncbi:MAG: Fic family protein [Candidatus Aquilonibacter sp.]
MKEVFDEDFSYRILFQREAQTFSPRLSGAQRRKAAYVNEPFIPFVVFDSSESLHFASAAQYAWQSVRKPYSKAYLCEIHRRLFPSMSASGRFRRTAAWLGPRRSKDRNDAIMTFASPEQLAPGFKGLESFADVVPATHRLAACAMIHLQFVSLHPFFDGNGRVARVMTPLLLRHYGLLDDMCLFVSDILSANRREYYARLESAQLWNEVDAWVRFFVRSLCLQFERHIEAIRCAQSVRCGVVNSISGIAGKNTQRLVDEAILSPTLSLSRIAGLLGLSTPAARDVASALTDRFGFGLISDADDPVYQFRDVYAMLAL